jgi:phosphoribosylformylglycinamidine synthase subunit PurSL
MSSMTFAQVVRGLLVAAAEMAFAGGLGLTIDLDAVPINGDGDAHTRAFGESPSRYLLEVEQGNADALRTVLADVPHAVVGSFDDSSRLRVADALDASVDDLRDAWRKALNW